MSELSYMAFQVDSPSSWIWASSVNWLRIRMNANSRFSLKLFWSLTYLETPTLNISLLMSMAFVARPAGGSIIFLFYLLSVHQTPPTLVYYLKMYSYILRLTWVNQSARGLAESNKRPRPLRPSHVPSNLGVTSGAPRHVFFGTADLNFYCDRMHDSIQNKSSVWLY